MFRKLSALLGFTVYLASLFATALVVGAGLGKGTQLIKNRTSSPNS